MTPRECSADNAGMSGITANKSQQAHSLGQTIANAIATQPLAILVKDDSGYLQKVAELSIFSEPSDSVHDYELSLARWPMPKGYNPLAHLHWEDDQLVFTSIGGKGARFTAEALRMLSPNCALTHIAQGITQYVTSQRFDLAEHGLVPHPLPGEQYRASFDGPTVLGGFERRFSLIENLGESTLVKDCGTIGWFDPHADPTADWTPFLVPRLSPNPRSANFDGRSQWIVVQVGIDTVSLTGGAGLFAEKRKGPPLLEFAWDDTAGLERAVELMSSNSIDELRTLRALVSPDDVKRWGWAVRVDEQRQIAYRGANRRKTRFPLLAVDQAFAAARKKVWERQDGILQAWGKPWSVAKSLDDDDRERRTLAMEIMFSHSYATSHEERALQRNFYTELSHTLPTGVKLLRARKTNGKTHILLVRNERLVHETWASVSMQGDMLSRLIGQAFDERFPEPPEWHRWDANHQRWRKYRIPS